MKILASLFFFLSLSTCVWSVDLVYDNVIYDPHIQTARLFEGTFEGAYPVLSLGSEEQLTLLFDELVPVTENASNFATEIIQCDADWQPSNVMMMEFYQGFTTQLITDYQRSENTLVPYFHYTYHFPQTGDGFKISGNYLLYVYRNGDKEDLILSKRFIVFDKKMEITPTLTLSGDGSRQRMTDLNFVVTNTGNLPVLNSLSEMRVVVLQNGRWDNVVRDIPFVFFRNEGWEYHMNINNAFKSGAEFRHADISSTRFYGQNMVDAQKNEDMWDVFLRKDLTYQQNTYRPQRDWNGMYQVAVNEWQNPLIQADYVRCHFSLKTPEVYDDLNVYVTGSFCDWRREAGNKLFYNENLRQYESTILLKQGQYDYHYITENPVTFETYESLTEGQCRDSENYYLVLIYYKKPQDRTHQLVACKSFNI